MKRIVHKNKYGVYGHCFDNASMVCNQYLYEDDCNTSYMISDDCLWSADDGCTDYPSETNCSELSMTDCYSSDCYWDSTGNTCKDPPTDCSDITNHSDYIFTFSEAFCTAIE